MKRYDNINEANEIIHDLVVVLERLYERHHSCPGDCGPPGEEWWSDEWEAEIKAAKAVLEKVTGAKRRY